MKNLVKNTYHSSKCTFRIFPSLSCPPPPSLLSTIWVKSCILDRFLIFYFILWINKFIFPLSKFIPHPLNSFSIILDRFSWIWKSKPITKLKLFIRCLKNCPKIQTKSYFTVKSQNKYDYTEFTYLVVYPSHTFLGFLEGFLFWQQEQSYLWL